MRHAFAFTTVFFVATSGSCAQENQATPVTDFFIARTSQTFSPSVPGYRLGEFFRMYGSWIGPDCGYIDFGKATLYREVFCGGGKMLHGGKRLTLIEEFYFDQASGPTAKSANYFQPWTFVQVNFSKKLTSETVYFPYLPLNHTATIQHVLEHAKVEYRIGHRWKVGVGYALYKFGNEPRQDKPFVTVTRETERWGAVELWPYQKIPTGAQMQLRYSLSHKHSS